MNFGIKDFRADLIKTFRVLWRTPEQHLKKVKCHIWSDSAYQVNDILTKIQTVHKRCFDITRSVTHFFKGMQSYSELFDFCLFGVNRVN